MKCFAILGLAGFAAAAPQYIADTPEVQQAKIAFAQAFNVRARASLSALNEAGVNNANPDQADFSPAALPYLHEEVTAVPYIHEDVPALPYVHDESVDAPAAPVQVAAPVQAPAPVQVQAPAYQPAAYAAYPANFGHFAFNQGFNGYAPVAPVQPVAVPQQRAGGCYNWKGEGVQCRTQF